MNPETDESSSAGFLEDLIKKGTLRYIKERYPQTRQRLDKEFLPRLGQALRTISDQVDTSMVMALLDLNYVWTSQEEFYALHGNDTFAVEAKVLYDLLIDILPEELQFLAASLMNSYGYLYLKEERDKN